MMITRGEGSHPIYFVIFVIFSPSFSFNTIYAWRTKDHQHKNENYRKGLIIYSHGPQKNILSITPSSSNTTDKFIMKILKIHTRDEEEEQEFLYLL